MKDPPSLAVIKRNPFYLDQTAFRMSRVKSPGCQSGREPHCQRTWFWASSNRSQLTAIGGWPQQTGRGGAETTNEAREQGMGILETKPSERMGTENQDKNRLGSLKSHVPRSWVPCSQKLGSPWVQPPRLVEDKVFVSTEKRQVS